MRILFVLVCILSLSFKNYNNSVYDYTVTTIEGQQINLSNYQGKKIIIVTLPIYQNTENNNYLLRLDSLSKLNRSDLVMIGFPSYENGYTNQDSVQLKTWYNSFLGVEFIVSKGVNTRKSSVQD